MVTRRMTAAFPEVAQIRKGGAKQPGKSRDGRDIEVMGKDLNDHFRVVFFPGTDEHQQSFLDAYKDKGGFLPTRIRAMVPFPSVWDAWRVYNEAYNAGRMVAQADDDHYIMLRDPLTGAYQVRDGEPFRKFTPGDVVQYDGKGGRKVVLKLKSYGNLRLFLPEVGALVAFTLKTTSYYDRIFIDQQLGAIQAIADALNGGNAAGIPFYVYRTLRDVTRNMEDGSAVRTKKWLVTIEADREYVQQAIKRLSNFALTGQTMAMLIPGSVPEISGTVDPDADDEADDGDDVASTDENGDVLEGASNAVVEATFSQPPAQPQQSQKPLARPYPAVVVKEKLLAAADDFASHAVTAGQAQRNLMRFCLEQCFAGEKDVEKKRKAVSFWLTGYESSKEIPDGWVVAMLDRWLSPKQDSGGSYVVNHHAEREAQAIYIQALKDAGQQELPL